MNVVSFCLFALSGILISRALLKDEKTKIERIDLALDLAKYISEQIEYLRLPISEILDGYSKRELIEKECSSFCSDDLPSVFEALCNDGGKACCMMEKIMEGSFDQATRGCAALKLYLENTADDYLKEYDNKKRIKTVFPIAVGILAGLFVI